MNYLVRFAPLILATASLVGCGSTPVSQFTQTSSEQPSQTTESSSELLLAMGIHGMAVYDLERDSAKLRSMQSGDFAGPGDVVSVNSATNTILRVRSDCDRGGCANSATGFSLEGGQFKKTQFTWLPGSSLSVTGTGKYAVGTNFFFPVSLQTYAVTRNANLLDKKTALPGYTYVIADPKADFAAAITLDPLDAPSDFGHGTLRLFRLYDNAFPTPLVETRVEPGDMTWNGDLIFIANRNLGSTAARGYALSAVHVIRDRDNETIEAHPREFWYIGDSSRITPSPDNRYLVAGSSSPGLFIYKLDPLTGALLNYPGVPLTGLSGDVSLTFDKDDTLLVADSDSATSVTKLYRLTLSASGDILESKFLGSYEGTTASLVTVNSNFDRRLN
jgi:hypothetical protein